MQSFHFKAFLRIIGILILGLIGMYLFKAGLTYSFILIVILIFTLFIELYFFHKRHYSAIDRIVLAMIYDDYSLKTTKVQTNETVNNLQKLYHKLQTQQQQNEIRELVYLNILNNIETGILILEKKGDSWDVFLINDYFSSLFDIPKIRSWDSLKRLLPSLANHLQLLNFRESKESIDIRIEEEDKQTFMLQTSNTTSQNQEYFIVLLDSIQKVLEKKEKDTWENLMKIISHEIMNSLTPIHSLAHNTQQILEEEENLSEEDLDDIKISISTIVNRTNHLQQFIDNYRKLTMLASPKKQLVNPQHLINLSVETLMPLFKSNHIKVQTNFNVQTNLEWDTKQMEQVLINLLTNAIHATAKQKTKEIYINLYEKNNRICIDIEDSGYGIVPEIKDKIFIPFYTTREEGAGIGLPLSKNIVEMHNGYLTYHRRDDRTVFSLNFPLY